MGGEISAISVAEAAVGKVSPKQETPGKREKRIRGRKGGP